MGAAAVILMLVLFGLLLLHSNVPENSFGPQARFQVPDLGPMETRPAIADVAADANLLASLQGKVVYINFWASWCEPCKVELPLIEKLQNHFGPEKFQVVLINVDTSDEAIKQAVEMQRRLTPSAVAIYKDTREWQQMMNVEMLPYHVVVDKKGRTAAAFYASVEKNYDKFEKLLQGLIEE